MALVVRIAATKRMRPPQLGHSKTLSSRPRRMSSAQVRLHGGATLSGALGAFWLRPGQHAQLRLVAGLEPSAPPHVNFRSTSGKG
jgi:hypothetical protein